jgi:hypothetical protein
MGSWRGGTPAHVATSQNASRPAISRDYRRGGPELGVQLAAFNASCNSCDQCDQGCGCAVEGGCTCGEGCGCGACQRLINGIASGGCSSGCGCGPCAGFCPNGQTYPEYPAFNQGPPVGQVAYPYYTTRGPRDFLARNPPSIGPY